MGKRPEFKKIKAAILTISDSCFQGKRDDESGEVLFKLLKNAGASILKRGLVPDDKKAIKNSLIFFSDQLKVDLILSTGGTGLGPRDVTPEATRDVIKKEVIGIAELMRAVGLKNTKRSILSRGLAGVRNKTLIINFPGSPKAVIESFKTISDIIPHVLAMMRGEGHNK